MRTPGCLGGRRRRAARQRKGSARPRGLVARTGTPLEVREEVWLGEVGVDVLGALPEEALETVAAPLDGVPN